MINLIAAKMKARIQAPSPDSRGVGAFQLVVLLLTVCIGLAIVQTTQAADTGAKTAGTLVSSGLCCIANYDTKFTKNGVTLFLTCG